MQPEHAGTDQAHGVGTPKHRQHSVDEQRCQEMQQDVRQVGDHRVVATDPEPEREAEDGHRPEQVIHLVVSVPVVGGEVLPQWLQLVDHQAGQPLLVDPHGRRPIVHGEVV